MTPEQCATAAKRPVRDLDTAWATCARTLRRARELGLAGWVFYVAGRGGALGADARADTVAAALGLIAPEAVRGGWDGARAVGPSTVAAERLAQCCRWGREHLTDLPHLDRLVALAERVIIAADPSGLPLFAAWRAMPVPEDGPGARAAALVHLLEEYRSGAHLLAVRACGLTPIEAVIAGPAGPEEVVAFGWQPPYPPRAPLMRKYVYAEAIADRIAAQAYAALEPLERREFAVLLTAAANSVAADLPGGQDSRREKHAP